MFRLLTLTQQIYKQKKTDTKAVAFPLVCFAHDIRYITFNQFTERYIFSEHDSYTSNTLDLSEFIFVLESTII